MRLWIVVTIIVSALLIVFLSKPAHSIQTFIIHKIELEIGKGIIFYYIVDTGSEEKNKKTKPIERIINRDESDAFKWYFDADDGHELSGRKFQGQTFEEAFEYIYHYRDNMTHDQRLAILFAGRIKRHIAAEMPEGLVLKEEDFPTSNTFRVACLVKERLDIICNNKEQFEPGDLQSFPQNSKPAACFQYSYFNQKYKVMIQLDQDAPLVFL